MKRLTPMMHWALPVAFLLAACAQTVAAPDPATRIIPAGPEPEGIEGGFNRAAIEHDLLSTARSRLGEATVRRALASGIYIFAKHYPGMVPPPPPGAGADWRYPEWPFALIFHENGQWMAASRAGVRAADPAAMAQIRGLVADPAFWRQPEYTDPRCTDAGASLLMLKVPGRAESIRRGSCGETERTQRLVLLAAEA